MEQDIRAVERWAELPREKLVAAVAAAVRRPPADPSRFWHAVLSNPVLAAAVRGVLSSLLRDKQGSRDEVYWTYRINTVRAALHPTDTTAVRTPDVVRAAAAPTTSRAPTSVAPTTPTSTEPNDVPDARPSVSVPAIEFQAPGV
jgi:hypothetical protein